MNAGIYIFEQGIKRYLSQGAIEKTAFQKLAKAGKLKAYTHRGFFSTVNDHKDLAATENILIKSKFTLL